MAQSKPLTSEQYAARNAGKTNDGLAVAAIVSTNLPITQKPEPLRATASLIDPKNWAAFTKSIIQRKVVLPQIQEARRAVCKEGVCVYFKKDARGGYCGVPGGCGCRAEPLQLAWMELQAVDITRYEEPQGLELLCKHPQRGQTGKGWPLPAKDGANAAHVDAV